MARKTATFVTCDYAGCNDVAEIIDEGKDAPEGWYHVMPAIQSTRGNGEPSNAGFAYQRSVHFEFSKLQCLERWARERRQHLEPRSTKAASSDALLNEITTAFESLAEAGQDWVKIADVAELTGIHQSTIRKYVGEMAQIETKAAKSVRNTDMTLYRYKTPNEVTT